MLYVNHYTGFHCVTVLFKNDVLGCLVAYYPASGIETSI